MTRLSRTVLAGVAGIALALCVAAPASAGTITPGSSAYSAGASTGTGALGATLALSGSLGRLIDSLVAPIVSQDLNPLVAALQGSASGTVAATLGSSSTLQAATTATQTQVTTAPAAFPNDTLPSPCTSGGTQPCYSLSNVPALNAAPLATVGSGAVSGYVEQVATSADATTPTFARSTVQSASVTALPLLTTLPRPLVSTGVIAAKANCPNDGATGATKPATAPSVSETASNVSAFNGLVTFGVLDGQITNLVVNSVAYGAVTNLPTVTVGSVTVSPFGNSVLLSLPLTIAQALTALGLAPGVVTDLNGDSPLSTLKLSVVLGPSAALTNRTAAAWGIGVGLDLSGSLSFTLLNLVTATVTVPTGIGGGNYGNLLDLRAAYATCQSGNTAAPTSRIVPPALV